MSLSSLYPWFLGPYGENNDLAEQLLVEFFRDHVYWRRNFHPEDPPIVPTQAALTPEYQAFVATMRRELHSLTAKLKRSVPFFSPRYLGHMVSDPMLPGLLAHLLTLPYNPNNVVSEASPATLDMELSAGLQLARLMGFPHDENKPDCAFGYLTSGGTVANYEGLRVALALKYFPIALREGLAASGRNLPALEGRDAWQLFNCAPSEVIGLYEAYQQLLHQTPDAAERLRVSRAVEHARLEHVGLVGFHARHPELPVPKILVPVTAHYSWAKSAKLFGLGLDQLVHVPTRGMRLDGDALASTLDGLEKSRQPVALVVGVLGTTEFGTIDPIDRLIAERKTRLARGFGFSVHVDAAWGGYLTTLFRRPDGSFHTREEVAARFRLFPSQPVYDAFAAVEQADSITIDPHKLGFLPYGTGAFLVRDHRAMSLLAQTAAYVFHDDVGGGFRERFHSLGRFILEGSKSGAAAAAAYVSHRTVPLDSASFGTVTAATIQASEAFWGRLASLQAQLADVATVHLPFTPDSNLVCIALNPKGNTSLKQLNAFGRALVSHLVADPTKPVQLTEYFASSTELDAEHLGSAASDVMRGLGLDPALLVSEPSSDERADDHVFVLRLTLMNPWLLEATDGEGQSVLDGFLKYLEKLVREAVS